MAVAGRPRVPAARTTAFPPSRHIRSPANKRQRVSRAMSEPTITCPNCKSEIKLTESLAAPLIDATRRQYDQKIAQKEAEVARREPAIRDHEVALARQKAAIDEETEAKLKAGREKIAAEEAR